MLRMHNVRENAQALLLEGRLETAVTPTYNSVAPGGAPLRDTWETIVKPGGAAGPGPCMRHPPAPPLPPGFER